MNIPLLDLGVLGMEREKVPEKSLMSFSFLKLSIPSLAADGRKHQECSDLALLGSSLKLDLGTEGVPGLRNSLSWLGISLVWVRLFVGWDFPDFDSPFACYESSHPCFRYPFPHLDPSIPGLDPPIPHLDPPFPWLGSQEAPQGWRLPGWIYDQFRTRT